MPLSAASCELGSIVHSGNAVEDTTAGRFQNSYGIRSGSYVGTNNTDWLATEQGLGAYTTFYHRGFFWMTGLVSGKTLLEYINSSGVPVFRFYGASTDAIQGQYWNGSAWTNIGGSYSVSGTNLFKFDFKIICGAAGSFDLAMTSNMSVEPSSVLSGSGMHAAVTNIDRIKAYSTVNSANCARHSEWIWGDEPTIGHRYAFAPPTGNGNYTAGSGAFGDVDEAITTDADVSTLANNGDAETYTHSAMALLTGTVKAVQIEARLRNVAGGAQNVKARLRIGGVDYDQGANFAGIGVAYQPYRARWATNPAGGSWTPVTAGQVTNEFGMLAQT